MNHIYVRFYGIAAMMLTPLAFGQAETEGTGTAALTNEIVVDCQKAAGTIRPLHGVNLGQLCDRGLLDLSKFHKSLSIPVTRLHDVVWFIGYGGEAVDVHTIFKDFRNDPNDERSYDFRATDDYIKSIRDVGSDIVYRLGESIEGEKFNEEDNQNDTPR